ncbi:MAG: CHAP domain-containing protein [Chloroflexia bacterium]|nr:CHAP domain-containing protein [Chloroflexia bacterium]
MRHHSNRQHVLRLGAGYLLAIAACEMLGRRLPDGLGLLPWVALLLLLLAHTGLSRQQRSFPIPALLSLAPLLRLYLCLRGDATTLQRGLALGLPVLAAAAAALHALELSPARFVPVLLQRLRAWAGRWWESPAQGVRALRRNPHTLPCLLLGLQVLALALPAGQGFVPASPLPPQSRASFAGVGEGRGKAKRCVRQNATFGGGWGEVKLSSTQPPYKILPARKRPLPGRPADVPRLPAIRQAKASSGQTPFALLLEEYPNCPAGGYENSYHRGVCTWYVQEKRPDLPRFAGEWGLALNWAEAARHCGFRVDGEPAAGAVLVFPPGANGASPGGHVAYVEAVEGKGLLISECNVNHNSGAAIAPLWWESGYACAFRRIAWSWLDARVQYIHSPVEGRLR